MAVGDVVSNIVSTSSGGALDIQPSAGVEWVIHNLYVDAAAVSIDILFYDGVNSLKWQSAQPGPVLISNMQHHVTNARWIRLVNNDAGSRLLGYDGVQTK